jgi:hypothetical protein
MVWDFIVISRRLSDEEYGEIYTRNQKGLEWNWSEKDKNMTFRIWHSEYDIQNMTFRIWHSEWHSEYDIPYNILCDKCNSIVHTRLC